MAFRNAGKCAYVLRVLVAFFLRNSGLLDQCFDVGIARRGIFQEHGKVFTLQCEIAFNTFEPFFRVMR
ncbi:MAG: hypothetical protein HY820_14235 [Acidobacteria bacterium]|nr:hypothetical protein [Acidobacteriota bacterium]